MDLYNYERRIVLFVGTFIRHESELPHVPERRNIIQTGKDILHFRSLGTVFQPALFDERPQLVIEPKALRPLRFSRPHPLNDCIYDLSFAGLIVIWVVSEQNLVYRPSADCKSEVIHKKTCFVDDHPKGIAIGLPRRSVALQIGYSKSVRV